MVNTIHTIVLDPEYLSVSNDLIHKWVLYTTYNLLNSIVNNNAFLSDEFIDNICFMTLGILLYWLVVRKIIQFAPPI